MSALIARLLSLFGRVAQQQPERDTDASLPEAGAKARMPQTSASGHPLDLARSRLDRLRALAERRDDPRLSSRLDKLCTLADAIVRETSQKPGLLTVVHRFYAFDLPVTVELLERYDRLMQSDYYNNEMEYRAKRIEHLLGMLGRRYIRHLNRFKQAELSQMDMELAAYERMLRQDETYAR